MKARTQRRLRGYHNWLGVFFAPGLLFFALTGALQTLGLHESEGGVRPPAWIAAIANLHKHQVASRGPRRAPPPRAVASVKGGEHDEHDEPFAPLKVYVLALSVVLFATTLLGIAVALTNRAARRRTWVLLALGTVVPLVLLAM